MRGSGATARQRNMSGIDSDDSDYIPDLDESQLETQPWARRLWSRTIGVATLYLKKPILPPLSEYRNLFTREPNVEVRNEHQYQRGARGYLDEQQNSRRRDLNAQGAEVRILRRIQFPHKDSFKPSMFDLGLGLRVGISPTQIQPVARVRLGSLLTLGVLPRPVIKLSHVLPLHWQGMQAHLRYEAPLGAVCESYHALWRAPARLLLRFEHGSNSGLHFYPGGIELGDHTVPLGETGTALRFAAGFSFPREVPYLPETGGKWEIHRLGIKAAW